jgi:cell wall-associated NlpC family hydrolase
VPASKSTHKPIVAAGAAAGGLLATVVLIPTVLLGGGDGGSAAAASVSQNAAATGGQCTYTPKHAGVTAAGVTLSASQLQIAGTAVGVAKQRTLPVQASIDVLAAGMQESTLTNLSGGDRDSVGFLQQRPSQGWGTVAQIMDPAYAAGKFFDHLLDVANWQKLPVGEAIQAVQNSGTPDAYTAWVPMATALASSLLGGPSVALTCAPGGAGTAPGQAPDATVGIVLARARAQLGLPYCFDGGTSTGPSHGSGGSGCGGQSVGFDCSGLALYAYSGAGVPLEHSAASQYTDPGGVHVPVTQVQPGDLVFLSSDGSQSGIHHVAMIWSTTGKADGSGQIIEAQDFNVPVHVRAWAGTGEDEVMPYAWRLSG